MSLFRYPVMLLLVLLCGRVGAQQFGFTRFSVDEGLPRSGVYCIMEDGRGYLWAGTEGGGLARFDGVKFEVFNLSNGLPGNNVRALLEDSEGNIWAGTDGQGLCRYDGKRFVVYDVRSGLSSNNVRSLVQDASGVIWVGYAEAGIDRLTPTADSISVAKVSHPFLTEDESVRSALMDGKGALWFATDSGVLRFQDEEWKHFGADEGWPSEKAIALFEDGIGHIWVGFEKGVGRYDGKIFTKIEGHPQASGRVRAIAQDTHGSMWFGTKEGVLRHDDKGFSFFNEANGLSNARIRDVLVDRSGNVWFGTYYGGLCRFSGEQFVHVSRRHGLASNQVFSVLELPDGTMRIGTVSGVNDVRPIIGAQWDVQRDAPTSLLANVAIHAMALSAQGEVWHGTERGIVITSAKGARQFSPDGSVFQEHVKALLFGNKDDLWVGTMQGVTRFVSTGDQFAFDQYFSHENLFESEVSSLCMDGQGRLWAGFLHGGVVMNDGADFVLPVVPQNLRSVTSMVRDASGRVWIGTEGHGLFAYRGNGQKPNIGDFRHYGVEQGLVSLDIHQLAFDRDGNLWTGSANGVSRITLQSDGQIGSVRHFGREDGFTGTETNDNAICMDSGGHIWSGTVRGVTRFDPRGQKTGMAAPITFIQRISLGFDEVDWSTSDHAQGADRDGLPLALRLPFEINSITFHVKAIDLTALDRVRYQWKLLGFQDEWSPMSAIGQATFTNLPPGGYTFMLMASNPEGLRTAEPVSFVFTVLAPFYLSWWFILLALLAVAGVVYLVVRMRERKLERDRLWLQQLVDDRTEELRDERDRSDELLLNILPKETAEELKLNGKASVRHYDMVSVLFTDFVGFTNITENISHDELVASLDHYFRVFDDVMSKFRIEKIKTIGDAYMAAGGIPVSNTDNPLKVVMAALEILRHVDLMNEEKRLKGEPIWQLRAGIHTGSVIAGVVGKNKFAYDIWGDAVNTAARMESSGEVGRVNISGSTHTLVGAYFQCTHRGKIAAKNKGHIDMFFVDALLPEYRDTEQPTSPNAKMLELMGLEENVAV